MKKLTLSVVEFKFSGPNCESYVVTYVPAYNEKDVRYRARVTWPNGSQDWKVESRQAINKTQAENLVRRSLGEEPVVK